MGCIESLTSQGVRFLPVQKNSKLPLWENFSERATSDVNEIDRWRKAGFNVGIATGKVAEGRYLVGFDIDKKDLRNGFDTLHDLEAQGKQFTPSWRQTTPSHGEHRLYWSPQPIRQGTDVLGKGLDLRGQGGYLVGPYSSIDGKVYTPVDERAVADFPEWAVKEYAKRPNTQRLAAVNSLEVDTNFAGLRAVEYLAKLAPAPKGSRNDAAYTVACKLKDFGLTPFLALHVMNEHWKCEPMLGTEELQMCVLSAFQYGQNELACDAPEGKFEPIIAEPQLKNPLDLYLDKYFYAVVGGVGRVCWEEPDAILGGIRIQKLSYATFKEKTSNETLVIDDKRHSLAKLWLDSKKRKTYDQLVFAPGTTLAPNLYNLWRGFAVEPFAADESPSERAVEAVDMFFEHCLENVCGGDAELNKWLIGYFAHMFQQPQEKPGVALVFKGSKGVGKNALIDRVAHLLGGRHAVTVSDRRYLVGNFNSVMEDKLLFTLDEAFWSGEKQVEGILKDLITGGTKLIEHKGCEPYLVKNGVRVAILGNEDWLVPATWDERRYAVFDVGDKRRGDRKFFQAMRIGMEEHGGDRLLLTKFLEYDLSDVDASCAPRTKGLRAQQENSLPPLESWWLACLHGEAILGSGNDNKWPTEISTRAFQEAFYIEAKRRGKGGHLPTTRSIGHQMLRLAPSMQRVRARTEAGSLEYVYYLPPIDIVRMNWEKLTGFDGDWDD